MKEMFRWIPNSEQIPDYIANNLKFPLRPYQEEALKNHLINTRWSRNNSAPPEHLPAFRSFWPQDDVRREIYNMATGSGKTLVMAALLLEYFKQGYRDFLFFVHTNSIIKKTKINFLRPGEQKYLFAERIMIDGDEVFINEVESFDESHKDAINIKFMTIGKMHSEYTRPRENGLDFSSFESRDVVFLADEFHHYHAETKKIQKDSGTSWEEVIEVLLLRNMKNVYLGFTATLEEKNQALQEKLDPKIIYKYDLREFRNDGFSKEIHLLRSGMELRERVFVALLMNIYRSALAAHFDVNLKPVILFKSRTIDESTGNRNDFVSFVDGLKADYVTSFKQTCDLPIIRKAFEFFDTIGLSEHDIVVNIQTSFSKDATLCMNDKKQLEANQILVNTLEDDDNPIRAVFAVDKLNEGWDVLTLFDIVRMFVGSGKGATPVAEAQLIGRGARLFPFKHSDLESGKRKFDHDLDNELRVLEELYYHSCEDREYVNKLKKELTATGLYDDPDDSVTCTISLKQEFKETDFYQTAKVVTNTKREKTKTNIVPFERLQVGINNHKHRFTSMSGYVEQVYSTEEVSSEDLHEAQHNVGDLLDEHGISLMRTAIDKNPFFNFGPTAKDDGYNIATFYPDMNGIGDFVESLSQLSIDFVSLEELTSVDFNNRKELLSAFGGLLSAIEKDIRSHLVLYEGTEWVNAEVSVKNVRDVFEESKELNIPRGNERINPQQEIVADADWYVYDANYGTSEEKAWIQKFKNIYNEHKWKFLYKFEFVYMMRNEEWLRIVNIADGRGFKPDYVLFCKERDTGTIHQIFCEPKGEGFRDGDEWKELLLKDLRKDDFSGTSLDVDGVQYIVSGTDLYTQRVNENEIEEQLLKCLSLPEKDTVEIDRLKAICLELDLPNELEEKDELIEILMNGEAAASNEAGMDIPDWDMILPAEAKKIVASRPELEDHYRAYLESSRF